MDSIIIIIIIIIIKCVDGKKYHWNSTCHGSMITYNVVY